VRWKLWVVWVEYLRRKVDSSKKNGEVNREYGEKR